MAFAKHETFHIREGWLFKGMSAIKTAEAENQPATIFLDRYAPEKLGIGRNMVRSLRFWMQATWLAEEVKIPQAVQRLTPLGEWIWGYDPYLEDESTLWLIHYHLVCNYELATTWYWFFNHFSPTTFDDTMCVEALRFWVISEFPDLKIALNSLKKDVSCLLRTYLFNEKLETPEDLTESPLSRLGLLSNVGSSRQPRYRLERLDSNRLHPLIMLYVLIDRQLKKGSDQLQINLSQVLREPMNVGRAFNLNTTGLTDLLATLNKQYPDWRVQFVRTAGLDQLNLPPVKLDQILIRYAEERREILRVA